MSPVSPGSAALERASGRAYWRNVEELLPSPDFLLAAGREFSPAAADSPDGMSRRRFMKLLGASAALAGAQSCMEPAEHILPYVRRPVGGAAAEAQYYATSMMLDGFATGLLVKSHAGRPTKVEGNPDHPASLGAAGVYEQASVLGLYDPQRARVLRSPRGAAQWSEFLRFAMTHDGAGLAFLLEPTSSPLVEELINRIRADRPRARFFFHSPLASDAPLEAARRLFGSALIPQFEFRQADVILALDADFLSATPFHLRYARHFAERRRVSSPADTLNRLYAVEGTPSVTGAVADHRLRVRASDVRQVAAAMLAEVLTQSASAAATEADLPPLVEQSRAEGALREWVRAVARDLDGARGRSIVIVGERQPPEVHVLGHALNVALGNIGRTVSFTASPIFEAGDASHDLGGLAAAMRAGQVRTLVVIEGNPFYSAPVEFEFAHALEQVQHTVYCGLHENETAHACGWLIPAAHYLEAWGDGRAYDGTVSLVQPLIHPLYGGKTATEVLAAFSGNGAASAHALLREHWQSRLPAGADERAWQQALQLGVVANSALPQVTVARQNGAVAAAFASVLRSRAAVRRGVEVVFTRDATIHDGRFANNAWLQELPDPLTKLTWGNAALISPATAAELGVDSGALLTVRSREREIMLPAFVLPGHADDSVSIALGYGRAGQETTARGVGVNAYLLRTASAPYFDSGAELARAAGSAALATTQTHWAMHGRPIVLGATLEEYRANPDFTRRQRGRTLSLYRPYDYDSGDQWAMVIDLSVCIGCNACVVACQAENNVPVVGKEGVLDSREMHWLRIDRYFSGSASEPRVAFQPMLCQHCEQAPCEYVCPVNATVHSPDGLNEMVYNRCVGTRFCSNNCPYKVRRFNWFDYSAALGETAAMAANPDVTVRERGVMEKCTFCVQRVRQAQINARMEDRNLRPGEVRTACQQACPTQAIVFGSYTDPDDELLARLRDPRRYSVLHELGTEPRVTYLARITNPANMGAEEEA